MRSDALWLLVAVFAPLLGALAIVLNGRKGLAGRRNEIWSLAAALPTLLATLYLLSAARAGGEPSLSLLELAPGLSLAFRADALGVTFALLASGLWVLAIVFSAGYVRDNALKHRARYFACFAASIGTAVGVALAANLLTFILFYEALTLATYPLVMHKETQEARRAARMYLAYALSGGALLTFAAAWTWVIAGSLDFAPGGFVQGAAGPAALGVLFLCYVIGTGIKAAVMPFHGWLPAAMVAPSPVSALLHAVAVVKAGVFGCMRVLGFTFGPESLRALPWNEALAAVCAFTIVAGSLIALRQGNLKKRLAYSTVVHLSYIVLGAALLTPLGFTGSVLHMVNHGLAKITLFFCAGAIYATAHLTEVRELKGLAKRMPWTCAAFTVASLSLVGIPGLSGFVSKLTLVRGALEGGHPWHAAVLLGASLLTAAYLFPIIRAFYFEKPDPARSDAGEEAAEHAHARGEARLSLRVPLLVTAALVVVFGIVPGVVNAQYALAAKVAAGVFGLTGGSP